MAGGKRINELEIGQKEFVEKTISETDIYLYAGITGDLNPAHVNEEYAKNTFFKGRIAHGMLTAGLISAVLGMKLPGPGTIYMAQDVGAQIHHDGSHSRVVFGNTGEEKTHHRTHQQGQRPHQPGLFGQFHDPQPEGNNGNQAQGYLNRIVCSIQGRFGHYIYIAICPGHENSEDNHNQPDDINHAHSPAIKLVLCYFMIRRGQIVQILVKERTPQKQLPLLSSKEQPDAISVQTLRK
jgi:hypothetical protein